MVCGTLAMSEFPVTSPYVHSRLDPNPFSHEQHYARVDLNPIPESTLSPSHGLWIWPLQFILNICGQGGGGSVFRIHDILVWIRIRIRGSMPLTNGSSRRQQKLLITFLRYIFIIFQR
jgi:hypothetical protein